MVTNPIERARELRKTLISGDKVLVVDYTDTLQKEDTSKVRDVMPNVDTGEGVFRAKVNVKEMDPIAIAVYGHGEELFDTSKKSKAEIEEFIKKSVFDFPLWFKHDSGFLMKRVGDFNTPFIMQVGGCNFHDGSATGGCWYCFVDDVSNDGLVANGKTYLGISSTIDSMIAARAETKKIYSGYGRDIDMRVLRTSGGEPTIVLDWILNLWREIDRRGLDIVGQIDSNLSTGPLVDEFEKEGIFEPHTLEKLAMYPVKVLTAIKGVDPVNLQDNVQSSATIEDQIYSIKRFLRAGFDIYPQMYNPNPETLESYLRNIETQIENIALRIHIGPLKIYGPTTKRLTLAAEKMGVNPQLFIAERKAEWDRNYALSCEVLDTYLRRVYRVGYKDVTRSDVNLRLR